MIDAILPDGWQTLPLRRMGTLIRGQGGTKADNAESGLACVRYGEMYTRFAFAIRSPRSFIAKAQAANYTPIQFGDVLFALSGETIDDIGASAECLLSDEAVCGGDMAVFRPRVPFAPGFLGYACSSRFANDQKSRFCTGTTVKHIGASDVGRVVVPFPPPDEQAAIVRFLDHANRRIDRFIRAKRKLIALLNEQKQAIIHRAVTRGLDPTVPMKDSGVPWIGEIPAHWDTPPLKSVCDIQSGVTLGKEYGASDLVEFPYLRVANVQVGRVELSSLKRLRLPLQEANRALLRQGDVLMTEGGDPDKLGRGCVWSGEVSPCLHQNHVFAVRPETRRLVPEFLASLLESPHGRRYFEQTAKQTTNLASTNRTTIGRFVLLLPDIAEQRRILDALASELGSVNAYVHHTTHELTLLREYRTRLISDVVTGRLDVRAAAASLPVDDAEAEATDDLDADLADDEDASDETSDGDGDEE